MLRISKPIHRAIIVLFSTLYLLLPLCGHGQAQSVASAGITTSSPPRSARTLMPSEKRVVFEASQFAEGSVIPYWDKGYLISIVPESVSPATPNVRLYDATGTRVREVSIWFPGAQTVYILSAAVTPRGQILASGTAVKSDGTRAYFIQETDGSGKRTNAIQTNPFLAEHVCATTEGSVWAFGDVSQEASADSSQEALLREFNFQKGQIDQLLPRSTFGTTILSPASRGGAGHEVYFRCLSNKLVIYSGVAQQFVEFDTTSHSANRFAIEPSTAGVKLTGFAATNDGEVYGSLRNSGNPDSVQGLFHLDLDATAGLAHWTPVIGASGKQSQRGVVSRLWGADGNYLVHNFADDPPGRSAASWSVSTLHAPSSN